MRLRQVRVWLLLLLLVPMIIECRFMHPNMTARKGFAVTHSEAMQYDALRVAGMTHAQARQTIQITRESQSQASKEKPSEGSDSLNSDTLGSKEPVDDNPADHVLTAAP